MPGDTKEVGSSEKSSIVSKHGDDLPQRPLEATLDDLGGSLGTGERAESGEGPERDAIFRAEEERLASAAVARGILAPASELIQPSPEDGREHRVAFDPATGLYTKTTHPGSYGGYLDIGYELDPVTQRYEEKPLVLHATPREYLDRLRLANEVFADNVQITRVITTPQGLSVESTQPAVKGRPATAEEIRAEMLAAGFRQVHPDGVFYRASDGVLTWDLHGNALLTPEGKLAVIDAMIRTAPESLAAAIEGR